VLWGAEEHGKKAVSLAKSFWVLHTRIGSTGRAEREGVIHVILPSNPQPGPSRVQIDLFHGDHSKHAVMTTVATNPANERISGRISCLR
jgi:hypothetical protein